MVCHFKVLVTCLLMGTFLVLGCADKSSSSGGNAGSPNPENPAETPTETVWTPCAQENGVCLFEGTADVRYGIDGVFVTQRASFAKVCSNNSFGVDPVPGVVKLCEYGNLVPSTPVDNEGWIFCANEHEHCNFTGEAEVRYGHNHIYFKAVFTDGVDCNNQVFGDPLVGIVKKCEYRPR